MLLTRHMEALRESNVADEIVARAEQVARAIEAEEDMVRHALQQYNRSHPSASAAGQARQRQRKPERPSRTGPHLAVNAHRDAAPRQQCRTCCTSGIVMSSRPVRYPRSRWRSSFQPASTAASSNTSS